MTVEGAVASATTVAARIGRRLMSSTLRHDTNKRTPPRPRQPSRKHDSSDQAGGRRMRRGAAARPDVP